MSRRSSRSRPSRGPAYLDFSREYSYHNFICRYCPGPRNFHHPHQIAIPGQDVAVCTISTLRHLFHPPFIHVIWATVRMHRVFFPVLSSIIPISVIFYSLPRDRYPAFHFRMSRGIEPKERMSTEVVMSRHDFDAVGHERGCI